MTANGLSTAIILTFEALRTPGSQIRKSLSESLQMSFWAKKRSVDTKEIAAKIGIAYKKENSSMNSVSVTVSKRGYIVLPASLRKEMEIKKGTRMLLSRADNKIILQPVPSFTEKLAGLTAQSFGKTADEIETCLDEERKDR